MINGFLKRVSLAVMAIALTMALPTRAENYFDEVGDAVKKQRVQGEGTGTPTRDIANILTGVINVEAVFGTFHANEVVRDMDTRACGEIGVKHLAKGGAPTGLYCCEMLWETEGKDLMSSPGIKKTMGGALGGWDDHKRSKLKSRRQFMDYCCRLADDKNKKEEKIFCQTVAMEKAGCVKGKLKHGADLEEAMSACEVSCDPKYYGTLKHNEDGKYKDEEVDKLMRQCTEADVEWAPSTTVPGPEEFMPVVPESVRNSL